MNVVSRAAERRRASRSRLAARGAALVLALVPVLGAAAPGGGAAGERAAPAGMLAQNSDGAAKEDAPGRRAGYKRTGLPLPRFASLRADEANMRAGPGVRYPVEWVYRRRGLPLKIIAEFDTWRKVQDWRGSVGWMHRSMLSGKRTAIVDSKGLIMLRKPRPGAPAVARVEAGVVARIRRCRDGWCRIEAGSLTGWVPQVALWGTEPGEVVD